VSSASSATAVVKQEKVLAGIFESFARLGVEQDATLEAVEEDFNKKVCYRARAV
jgi:hypothetical protein